MEYHQLHCYSWTASKAVVRSSRTVGSNPTLSATILGVFAAGRAAPVHRLRHQIWGDGTKLPPAMARSAYPPEAPKILPRDGLTSRNPSPA